MPHPTLGLALVYHHLATFRAIWTCWAWLSQRFVLQLTASKETQSLGDLGCKAVNNWFS